MKAGKKSSKVIALSAVLVAVLCCIAVLLGAFSTKAVVAPYTLAEENKDIVGEPKITYKPFNRMMLTNMSSTQQDKRPLTWEAVKALVEGKLTYRELYATYYNEDIGSGFYILSFPIKDTEPYFLRIWFDGDMDEQPMAVRLWAESNDITLDLNEENLAQMMSLRKGNLQLNIEEVPYENERKISNMDIAPGNAASLQDMVDRGENQWLLNPQSVAEIMLGLKGGYFTNAKGEPPHMTLEYTYEYQKAIIELYQPVKTGDGGIWLVKTHEFEEVSNDGEKE